MIVRNWKDVAGIPHDETFVTPNTTLEVTDVDGNTRQVRYGDLSDEEKQAVSRRNSSTAILRAPDQTQEAADIRNMWGVAPRVSINNGKLKLSGTKSFLESDTAKILRNAFKEMDGKIYNTESLDKQIEGWNVALQQQAKDYIDAVEDMNWINYSTLQTSREGNPNLITFEDYLRIANNREVGKDANALNSDKLIFVGYEWDDDGNRIPKYVSAKDFAAEFNSTPNPVGHAKNLAEAWENRSADTLISGKRRAYSSLVAQANEGDVGAIAKLMYLQGGSTKGPANVVLSGEEKLKDFEFVAVNNIVNGLVSGLDYATAPYNVLFGNPLGLPRLFGRLGNAMSSGDFNKFWESDSVTKMREDYASVNDWTNNYFRQITPGSTDLAIGVGGTIGGVSGMLYSIVSADIGRELSAHTVSTALNKAGAWLEASGKGTRYTAYVTSFSGVQQQLNVTRNGATVSSIPTVANGARNSIQVSVVIPNFIVRNHEGFAKALIDASFKAQAAAQGVSIAGNAGSNISYVITSKNDALTQLLTPDVWRDMQAGSTALSAGGRFTINVLQGASLEKLRNMENGLRASMSLALQGAHAALRSADEYLRKSYDGEDLGDMATYVANDVATSVVAGATLLGIGQWIKDAKDIANAANIPPTRILDTSKLLSDNQAGGFYQQEPEFVWSQDNGNVPLANRLQEGGMTPQEYNEIVKTFGSIITANGEKFFLPNDISEAMVVPGAASPEGVDNAIGVVKDGAVEKSTIVPAVGGFNVVTTSRSLLTGETTTGVTFHLDFDSANRELQNNTIPVVNPKTLGNSDLAVSAPVMPLDLGDPAHGSISAVATLPDGTSRIKIDPGIAYYTLDEFSAKLSDIVSMMSPEAKDVYMATVNAEDNELWKVNEASAATGVMYAPDFSKVPTTADEAVEFARRVSYVLRYAAQNGNVIIPTRIPATTAETRKLRRMTTERKFISGPMARGYNNDFAPTGAPVRARLAPAEYYVPFEVKYISRDEGERIEEKIPAEWQRKWFVEGAREYRDKIADLILSDPELRNACLVKMYDEWVGVNNDMGVSVDIPYEEWVDTDITLYRWSGGKNHGDSKVLSYSFFPGGYPQFGRKSDSITITPRETTGMGDWFNEEGSEQEVFVPTEIVAGKQKLDTELKERQKSAIAKAGKKAPDVSDIKTYSEVMTNDILNHGLSDDFTRGDIYKALITNRIKVYSNTPIEDGALVTPIQSEVELPDGGELYSKEVNLSDVAWKDASKGIFASDTIYPTLFDWAKANPLSTVEVDNHGVRVKHVRIGDHDAPIDYEIADRIAELNKNGFKTYNSHSGIAADHESPSDAGGGYIQFNGAIGKEKLSAIKKAADAAGMNSFEEYNMFYGPVMLVYQHKLKNGQTREDIIRQANLNTATHYGLPRRSAFTRATTESPDNKSWLTLLEEQGKFNEGLDYRDDEIKRLEKEAGGYLQDTDELRRKAWDKFFSKLGIEKTPNTTTIETTKSRKTINVETSTPNKYVVTENGLTKESFSDPQTALDFKNEAPGSRQIYELDDNAPIMERPPVTSDSLYYPTVRSDSALGRIPTEEEPAPDNTIELMAKFDSLLTAMDELKDSPTDYTQGIIDIVRLAQQIYNAVAAKVDIATVYEDYARQIADNVEQPDADPEVKEILKPLLDVLNKLGHYFDPSGKSLTKKFYLPTSLPGTNLVSLEEYLASVEGSFDSEHPVITSFDDILIDPTRIGDSGFWEQRTGDLFRDEDGNFTMDRAATLEESLIAYTISALTRGKGALTVAANNEIAASKNDRNRNQITGKAAVKGLTMADEHRARIRASQLKAARGFSKAVKNEKLDELKDKYTDENVIDAIDKAFAAKNFVKSIDYVHNVNDAAGVLGYRRTLTINSIKGSTIRFGSQGGLIKGTANDIRVMSRVNITGTKYVTRYGEKVCVGYGMSPSQQNEYEFTRIEPAVNLGDATDMAYNSDKFAIELFRDITESYNAWIQQGSDEALKGLLSKANDFARSNFRLIANPERAGADLVHQLIRNYTTYYRDPNALHIANLATTSDWIKRNALNELNSAIKMADLTLTDKRTINAINEVMTSLMVGTPVYISQVTNFLTRASYSAALGWSASPAVGNLLSETGRLADVYSAKVITRALKRFFRPSERRKLKEEFADQVSRYGDDQELVGLLAQTKGIITKAIEGVEKASMTPLEWSEAQKNYLFYLCADENAKLMYPNDPSAQMQNKLRMFNDTAIAGGAGTTPNIAKSNIGRLAFIFKTFTLRNWDDFIEMAENIGYGRSGSYKWDESDRKGGSTGGQGGYSTPKGEKFNYKKAGRFVGGTFLRRYLLWLFVLGPLGRSIWDALGGDPTGLSENFSRGLYDDENTDEYEGMTPLDNFINMLPTGFILGTLKDLYFAARRSGVQTNNFFGPIDVNADARLQKDLRQHLPFGVATNRLGDMLDLLDRGYSFTGAGNKAYAAPESFTDTLKGMLLGKNTTSNAMAYNKYRYGSVDVWGNILEGDWLDFAMTANPFADTFGMVKFDSTRENYNGVFHGDYSDVPTMQAAVADLRNRRSEIVKDYYADLEKFSGPFEGLKDADRKALAEERRDKKIEAYTNDVKRLVDAYTEAGNKLSDKQINTLMYLFDFNEGDEDEYDSQIARRRYVEAGLPDVNAATQPAKVNQETGETEDQNYFQRSLVYQNAVQGRYGIPREAAKTVDAALAGFKNTYKEYKKRVSNLNDKAYAAAKGSNERKKYQAEVEKVQEEYLNQLYAALNPVIQKYGTEVLSSNDVIESLQPFMSSMVPYSSIKKYGLQFNSGNDIVWGQLSDWIKNRWGASSPTAGSDPEVTAAITRVKSLIDQGKKQQAVSEIDLVLDRIARGTLSARHDDIVELRRLRGI